MVYLCEGVPETSEENFLGLEPSFHCGFQKPNSCFSVLSNKCFYLVCHVSGFYWSCIWVSIPCLVPFFLLHLPTGLQDPTLFSYCFLSLLRVCCTGTPIGNRESASSDPIEIRISKPWPVAVITLCRYGLLGHSQLCYLSALVAEFRSSNGDLVEHKFKNICIWLFFLLSYTFFFCSPLFLLWPPHSQFPGFL